MKKVIAVDSCTNYSYSMELLLDEEKICEEPEKKEAPTKSNPVVEEVVHHEGVVRKGIRLSEGALKKVDLTKIVLLIALVVFAGIHFYPSKKVTPVPVETYVAPIDSVVPPFDMSKLKPKEEVKVEERKFPTVAEQLAMSIRNNASLTAAIPQQEAATLPASPTTSTPVSGKVNVLNPKADVVYAYNKSKYVITVCFFGSKACADIKSGKVLPVPYKGEVSLSMVVHRGLGRENYEKTDWFRGGGFAWIYGGGVEPEKTIDLSGLPKR